ncbi:MAG: response regulator [Candidatus Dormibacteria bacterium]
MPNQPGRVLIVDVHPDAERLYGKDLRGTGYSVQVTATAAEGMAAARRDAPDLVIAAVILPDGDGFALVRGLARAVDPSPRFVLISDSDDFESAERGLALGLADYLIRHAETSDDLLDRVSHWLSKAYRRPLRVVQ